MKEWISDMRNHEIINSEKSQKQRGHTPQWDVSPPPWVLVPLTPSRWLPLKNLERIFFKQEFFRLTFYRSWRLNKHTRTLKTSRHTSDKGKGMGAHHLINWWFPMIWNHWVWKLKVFRNFAILQTLNYLLTILLINFL